MTPDQKSEFEQLKWQTVHNYNVELKANWDIKDEVFTKSEVMGIVTGKLCSYHGFLIKERLLINKEVSELLDRLAMEGGQILCTASLTENEISIARMQDRLAVNSEGIGYVWFPTERIKGQE